MIAPQAFFLISGAEPKQTQKKYKLAEGWNILPLSLRSHFLFFETISEYSKYCNFIWLSIFLFVYV